MKMKLVLVSAVVFVALSSPAAAAEKKDPHTLAASLASEIIAPRFAALDKAFGAQAEVWDKDCTQTDSLKSAFQAAYDAWAQAEFFKSGPLAQQTRAERIDYWPDPRNFIDKGVKAVLSVPSAADITAEKIAGESVAVQGLPALERLLYAGEAGEAKAAGEKECAAGRAIARNLATVAAALDREWNDGEAVRLKSAAQDETKARETAVAVLTDLATGIRVIEDKKIPPLFGAKGNPPNPRAAKVWRSQRSERDIAQNLAALIDAYQALAAFAPESAHSVVEKLQDASTALADTQDANRTIAVLAAINNAKYYAVDVVPTEIGVSLGFNSLDGD